MSPLRSNNGELNINKIINISITEFLNVVKIFDALLKLLSSERSNELQDFFQDSKISIRDKLNKLLTELQGIFIILILDDFEKVIDFNIQDIKDLELKEALIFLLEYTIEHPFKVIVISKLPPGNLLLVEPGRQDIYPLKGLPSPYAENYLRLLDSSGTAHLKFASEDLLKYACDRLERNPRALEILVGYLRRYSNIISLSRFLKKKRKLNFQSSC